MKYQVEKAVASVYFQAMLSQRTGTPSDADLQRMYDEVKKQNAGIPPFEAVKPQLAQGYPQYQLLKEIMASTPVTFSDEVGALPF